MSNSGNSGAISVKEQVAEARSVIFDAIDERYQQFHFRLTTES